MHMYINHVMYPARYKTAEGIRRVTHSENIIPETQSS